MARRCKCGCRADILPVAKCTTYMEKLGFATEECQQTAAIAALNKHRAKNEREANASKVKTDKAERVKHREAKAKIKKRTGKNGYYDNLKVALHYYVKHVLRKGEPCYTCGLKQKFGDSPQAFHVGHFMAAKMVDPRRFMPENLRLQCYRCNVPNSGMRAEYRLALTEEKGIAHVEWLECEVNHKSLKEQYPGIEDIKKDTAHYRKLGKGLLCV